MKKKLVKSQQRRDDDGVQSALYIHERVYSAEAT